MGLQPSLEWILVPSEVNDIKLSEALLKPRRHRTDDGALNITRWKTPTSIAMAVGTTGLQKWLPLEPEQPRSSAEVDACCQLSGHGPDYREGPGCSDPKEINRWKSIKWVPFTDVGLANLDLAVQLGTCLIALMNKKALFCTFFFQTQFACVWPSRELLSRGEIQNWGKEGLVYTLLVLQSGMGWEYTHCLVLPHLLMCSNQHVLKPAQRVHQQD